jgi:DNA-binding transcriptional ArsR family regulator
MPRKTAHLRHRIDDVSTDLMDVLVALHHPTRRWLVELLYLEGPATVGQLAARTERAVGSVSHHLKPLHRQRFIEPAPELARDTRESWWRVTERPLSWSVEDFAPTSLGRKVADQAELENFRHQARATQQWLKEMDQATQGWRRAAGSTDTLARATPEQTEDLHQRLGAVLQTWTEEIKTDDPAPESRMVRVILRMFPSKPVRTPSPTVSPTCGAARRRASSSPD